MATSRVIKLTPISDVRISDVVMCPDGRERTVCAKDLRRSPDGDVTLFGDLYCCGMQRVKVVQYETITCHKINIKRE